jgi:hypothetical protein
VSKDVDGLYGTISYGDKLYKLDIADLFKIINHNRGFHFHQKDDIYPSFNANRIRTSYFDFLYRHSRESVSYVFQNDDKCDLRKKNVKMYHKYHNEIIKKYPDAIYFEGHYSLQGKDAYMMKNPYWKIDDDVFLMYCERDTLVKLDERSIKMILDHIDQDPLNNMYSNLRIATQEEQRDNSTGIKNGTKKKRQKNARELPEGIYQDMLKKYVVYYDECYNREKDLWREFFKIESHPKLDKPIMSSKSNKVSIHDKLKWINQKVDELNNGTYKKEEKPLPQYYRICITRNKPHLIYERRMDNKRYNLRMKLEYDYEINDVLEKFNKNLYEKYPELK